MVQFKIQSQSDIPASQQLIDQLRFAIASRQFLPGQRLPSLRQLELITGLHRNTIAKIYRELETLGLVESIPGSGVYVKDHPSMAEHSDGNPLGQQYPEARALIKKTLDQIVQQGCSLSQARELFLAEMDWRLRCGARLLVTVPEDDLGAGELMAGEIEQVLNIPVQVVPLEALDKLLGQTQNGTVVTSRYFLHGAEAIAQTHGIRVIPLDIHDHKPELAMIQSLGEDSCLGIVSISPGILRAAETLVKSARGDELLVITAQAHQGKKLQALVRTSHTIIADPMSMPMVESQIHRLRHDLIRKPQLVTTSNYVNPDSLALLARELGYL